MDSDETERRRHRNREPIDYSPSSGAVDSEDAKQDQATDYATGRHEYTENKTFADEEIEVPVRKHQPEDDDPRHWNTLNELNRNFHCDNSDIRSEQRKHDAMNDVEMWGEQIGLTNHEIERAKLFVNKVTHGGKWRFGLETMILASLTLAANEGHRDNGTYPRSIRPSSGVRTTDGMVKAYRKIRDGLDLDKEEITSCRQHIREQAIHDNS